MVLFLFCVTLHAELFFTQDAIFTHLKGYSEEEVELVKKDLEVVRSVCFNKTENTKRRSYLATAGAPGARKTTILEKFIASHPEYEKAVYLDPDARALKFMVHTYYAQSLSPFKISLTNDYADVIKNAYETWRAASNYIALSLLEDAFTLGRNVVHGTTSTGAHIPNFFSKLKEKGYEIVLLLCSCPDELRFKAVQYRNEEIRFYQSSPEDAIAKGILFPQKMESYFSYADQLYFYWSFNLYENERLAGIWKNGELEILDEEAMQHFINKYEMDRSILAEKGILIRSFEEFLKK